MNIYHIKTDGKAPSTGKVMRAMVDKFYRDMAPYATLSAVGAFNLIKNLPYRPDPEQAETIMRPLYTLNMQGYGGDCDCKAIAMASWAKLNRIPYRFIAIRRPGRDALHHVATELFMDGKWIFFDPTYRFNRYAVTRPEAERVII